MWSILVAVLVAGCAKAFISLATRGQKRYLDSQISYFSIPFHAAFLTCRMGHYLHAIPIQGDYTIQNCKHSELGFVNGPLHSTKSNNFWS